MGADNTFGETNFNPDKKAYRVVWAEGHYGGAMCSNCSADCDKHWDKCPNCGVEFTEKDDIIDFRGSDF